MAVLSKTPGTCPRVTPVQKIVRFTNIGITKAATPASDCQASGC
jgi:hypothetical protein